jgi:PEP-CTERM motif
VTIDDTDSPEHKSGLSGLPIFDNLGSLTTDIKVVAEPSTLMSIGSGAVGLLGTIRRKL